MSASALTRKTSQAEGATRCHYRERGWLGAQRLRMPPGRPGSAAWHPSAAGFNAKTIQGDFMDISPTSCILFHFSNESERPRRPVASPGLSASLADGQAQGHTRPPQWTGGCWRQIGGGSFEPRALQVQVETRSLRRLGRVKHGRTTCNQLTGSELHKNVYVFTQLCTVRL